MSRRSNSGRVANRSWRTRRPLVVAYCVLALALWLDSFGISRALASPVPQELNVLWFVGFDHRQKPLDDVRVRLAIAHAIDKPRVVALIPGSIPAAGIQPAGWKYSGARAEDPYPYNPDKNESVDSALAEVAREQSEERKRELFRKIEDMLLADVPVVPIAWSVAR